MNLFNPRRISWSKKQDSSDSAGWPTTEVSMTRERKAASLSCFWETVKNHA